MKPSYSVVLRTGLALIVAVSGLPASVSSAADSNLTSTQVAAEILRVQAKADETAEQWAEVQSRSESLAAEIEVARANVSATTAVFDQLQLAMTQIAVHRFTNGSGSSIVLQFHVTVDEMQRDALRELALNFGAGDLDNVDAVRSDLQDEQANLEALSAQNTRLLNELAANEVELNEQLVALAKLHEQLKDEEVKRAYEAQLAIKRQEAAKAAAKKATGGTAVNTGGSWLCPIAGATAFGDSWGAPRSGGRQHQGVDMMAAFGTPVVAVVSGNVEMKVNSLGGNIVWLRGSDGNAYYYAHLSSWQGNSRSVSAGEVIGYIGATGNTNTNHLHFEIHPGGGSAVNPYWTVRQFC
ncbi:MAG: peptidoglycan DD-metalloendopeptidase family protein [Ilumatobacteraceae bacterium]